MDDFVPGLTGIPKRLGRYELIRSLGRGATGQVVEATLHGPAGFRKQVALKLLRGAPGMDAGDVAAIVREARLGGLLSHPNLVSTLELGHIGEFWFVSMELVRGQSLSALRVTRGPLPPAAVVDVGLHTCAGLSHLHRLGDDGHPLKLVHRDVKPSNLLLDASGLVRLADFGVSGLQAELVGRMAGTPGYMPPEQAGGKAEQRSDLFALGMTLLSLSVGRNPLGRGIQAVRAAMRIESYLARSDFLGPADARLPGLGDVLRRCLRGDPAQRWRDAAELAGALRSLRDRAEGPSIAELADLRIGETTQLPGADFTSAATLVVPSSTRTRLPQPPGALIGRDALLASATSACAAGAGVVSLVGPAGVGKTRAAIELARTIGLRRGREVVFCELSAARSAEEVALGVVRAMAGFLGGGDIAGHAGRSLAGLGAAVVVLDNLEQVIEDAAGLVDRWAELAPDVTFLVTSRAPLRIAREHVVAVEPLSLAAGMELFALRRDRGLQADEQHDAERLIERVDRLPLAIELLAARGRTWSVSSLVARIDDRFRLLSGGRRGADPRHRTLEAAIEWSWALLTPWEQSALQQLSVFEGAFSLEAAEAVVDLTGHLDAPWLLDVLDTLQEQSLLRVRTRGFDLLQSVRDFGRARLAGAGGQAAAERRHGAWFALLGSDEACESVHRHGGGERLRALRRQLPDLVVATRRALDRKDAEIAVPAAVAALQVLTLQGPVAAGVELSDRVLGLELTDAQRARVLAHRGYARTFRGDGEATRPDLEQALAGYRAEGDPGGEAGVLASLASLERHLGHMDAARRSAREALAVARASGHRQPMRRALTELAIVDQQQSRLDEALAGHQESLAVARADGDVRAEGVGWANIASLRQMLGDKEGAATAYRHSLERLREVGDRRSEGTVLSNLGVLALFLGDRRGAQDWLRQALRMHRRFGALRSEGVVQGNLGAIAMDLGEHEEARMCFESALSIARQVGDRGSLGMVLSNLGELHADLGRTEAALTVWGESLPILAEVGNRRSEVHVRTRRALVAMDQGDFERAREDLDLAVDVARSLPRDSLLGLVARVRGRLHRLMGEPRAAAEALALAEAHATDATELARVHLEQGLLGGDGSAERLARAEALLGEGTHMRSVLRALAELRAQVAGAD